MAQNSAAIRAQQPVNTSNDIEALRKAMKGMGCDERTLIRTLCQSKYRNPYDMAQLVRDYNARFMRSLASDIESETRGSLETVLLGLIRGPLAQDAHVLSGALNRAGTDEEALMDVLLCRSNADVRAITAAYERLVGRSLLHDIKDDVDDKMYRLYSMVLAATRAEDAAPVIPHDVDAKVTELQRVTEGQFGANAVVVAQILTSCNDAQVRAIDDGYKRKYHRSLQDVIEKEFSGDFEDILLRILGNARNRGAMDAIRLKEPIMKTLRKDKLLINRVLALYWDPDRMEKAKKACYERYRVSLAADLKNALSGDYEDAMLALVGK